MQNLSTHRKPILAFLCALGVLLIVYLPTLQTTERMLASLYAVRGQLDHAIAVGRAAEDQSQQLLAVEPGNTRWIERAGQSHIDMAHYFLAEGNAAEAATEATAGCGFADALYRKDARVADWRIVHRDCLRVQGMIAFAAGNKAQALALAKQTVTAARSVDSTDPIEDRYGLAKAYRLLGDVEQSIGNSAAARTAWAAGLAAVPHNNCRAPARDEGARGAAETARADRRSRADRKQAFSHGLSRARVQECVRQEEDDVNQTADLHAPRQKLDNPKHDVALTTSVSGNTITINGSGNFSVPTGQAATHCKFTLTNSSGANVQFSSRRGRQYQRLSADRVRQPVQRGRRHQSARRLGAIHRQQRQTGYRELSVELHVQCALHSESVRPDHHQRR